MPHITTVESEAKFVTLLLSIAKSTRVIVGIKLAEHNFYNGQDELLLVLDEKTPISVSRVAEALNVRPSTVSKMLDRLIAKSLIQKIGDAKDARRTMVQITPIGLESKFKLIKLRGELEAELMASCSGDVEGALQTLESVAVLLKQRLARLR